MKTTYSKAQIARIMKLEELKRVESAVWMLDMRKRHADKIRKRRNNSRRIAKEKEQEANSLAYYWERSRGA